MKVWVYNSRNGNNGVFTGDREGFGKARKRQDEDNGLTPEEAAEDGWEVDGSEQSGFFSIDDGGSIELFEVE